MILLFGAFLCIGLFFIAADLLRLPTLAARKAMLGMLESKKSKATSLEVMLDGLAVRLAALLKLDPYKKLRLERTLEAAELSLSPEKYQAIAIVKAGCAAAGVLPALWLFPLVTPVFLMLAIMLYFKEIQRADKLLAAKRGSIETELPRFVATIGQGLKSSRDVLSMLESYRGHAGAGFARELTITTADMRSSSYEAALSRFETRINSPMLSDIVRGLIGVLRGDDGQMYFQMLSHDMRQLELQRLKAQALKIPPKIRVFSFTMLVCFIATWLIVIGYEIFRSMGTLF